MDSKTLEASLFFRNILTISNAGLNVTTVNKYTVTVNVKTGKLNYSFEN